MHPSGAFWPDGLRALPLAAVLATALVATGWSAQGMARAACSERFRGRCCLACPRDCRRRGGGEGVAARCGAAFGAGPGLSARGRFRSAATVLGDAVVLGDVSPRTMLSLALARTAMGQSREAVAALQTVQGSLPAADYGLALALAGDTTQGVNVLAEAVHSGQSNENCARIWPMPMRSTAAGPRRGPWRRWICPPTSWMRA
jgi:hypothetical protein